MKFGPQQKKLEKQLLNKGNFNRFFQINCFNFGIKQGKRYDSYQNLKKNTFPGNWGKLEPQRDF